MASYSFDSTARLYENFRPRERLVLVLEAMARGDEAEADRLRHACPRKTYTGPDAAFDDRFHMVLDIVTVVSIDLRSLTGQLRILHWAINTVQHFLTMHHIHTSMALLEGIRCGQGLSQAPYFSKKLWEVSDPEAAAKDGAGEAPGPATPAGHDQEPDLSMLGEDFVSRMEAVEKRSEHSTDLILRVLHRTGFEVAAELLSIWQAFGDFTRTRLSLEPLQVITACAHPGRPDLEDALKLYAGIKTDGESVEKYRQAICELWDRRFGSDPQ